MSDSLCTGASRMIHQDQMHSGEGFLGSELCTGASKVIYQEKTETLVWCSRSWKQQCLFCTRQLEAERIVL